MNFDSDTSTGIDNPDTSQEQGQAADVQPEAPQDVETPKGDPRLTTRNPLYDLKWADDGEADATPDTPETPDGSKEADVAKGDSAKPDGELAKPTETELILGKFKTQEDLESSYKHLEQKLHDQAALIKRSQQEQKNMDDRRLQIQEAERAAKDPNRQGPTEEELQKLNDDFMKDFYTRPYDATAKLMNNAVKTTVDSEIESLRKEMEPIRKIYEQQQAMSKWQGEINELKQTHSDFDEVKPYMDEIFEEFGPVLMRSDRPFEAAYTLGQRMKQQAGKPSEDTSQVDQSRMGDPDYIDQLLENDELRDRIIAQYAKQVHGKQPPNVIGNQPSRIHASAPNSIRSSDDAGNALKAYLESLKG